MLSFFSLKRLIFLKKITSLLFPFALGGGCVLEKGNSILSFLRIKSFERTAALGSPAEPARTVTGDRSWRGLRSLPGPPWLGAGTRFSQSCGLRKHSWATVSSALQSPSRPAIASQFSGCPRGWVKPARPVALTRGHHLTRP